MSAQSLPTRQFRSTRCITRPAARKSRGIGKCKRKTGQKSPLSLLCKTYALPLPIRLKLQRRTPKQFRPSRRRRAEDLGRAETIEEYDLAFDVWSGVNK